jgi:hypothetical protein
MAFPTRSHDMIISVPAGMLFAAAMLGISAVPALIYRAPETSSARLEPVKPMKNEEFAKAEFTPANLAAVLPNIRIVACIFSEKAVRHYVRPALVTLPSCGARDFHVMITENLIDITVSGVATIENADHPFTVVLQHNPPSVTEDGLIVTAVEVSGLSKASSKGPEEMVSDE